MFLDNTDMQFLHKMIWGWDRNVENSATQYPNFYGFGFHQKETRLDVNKEPLGYKN